MRINGKGVVGDAIRRRSSFIGCCSACCPSEVYADRLLWHAAAFWLAAGRAPAARLKDLVAVEGVRENQLIGYGLVVGLTGTGDRSRPSSPTRAWPTCWSAWASLSPTAIQVKNTAAVMVTATLPAFAQPGLHIDATVARSATPRNLQGGILLLTSLRGADGQVYAVAQGPVVTGGFVAGRGGTTQTVNHPTVGGCPAARRWNAPRHR